MRLHTKIKNISPTKADHIEETLDANENEGKDKENTLHLHLI